MLFSPWCFCYSSVNRLRKSKYFLLLLSTLFLNSHQSMLVCLIASQRSQALFICSYSFLILVIRFYHLDWLTFKFADSFFFFFCQLTSILSFFNELFISLLIEFAYWKPDHVVFSLLLRRKTHTQLQYLGCKYAFHVENYICREMARDWLEEKYQLSNSSYR